MPDELNAKLSSRTVIYNVSAKNFLGALTDVANRFHIPMGIEWLNKPEARAALSLSWNNATVNEIIADIAKTQPGYEVNVRNGIVHISCAKLVQDKQNFLRVRLNRFGVNNEPLEVASRRLRDLIRMVVSPSIQHAGGIAGSQAFNVGEGKINIEMRDVSVEDALDKLVAVSARKIWIVTFADDITTTASGFRRTLTLWNDYPIPDNEQPLFDILHWGDVLPTTVLGKM
jgi:hypothetical protein